MKPERIYARTSKPKLESAMGEFGVWQQWKPSELLAPAYTEYIRADLVPDEREIAWEWYRRGDMRGHDMTKAGEHTDAHENREAFDILYNKVSPPPQGEPETPEVCPACNGEKEITGLDTSRIACKVKILCPLCSPPHGEES